MSLTDTKIFPPLVAEGSPALESQLVQDELSKLTADHENLIRLGVNFRQFDPRGKEAFLDQLEMIQEPDTGALARFHHTVPADGRLEPGVHSNLTAVLDASSSGMETSRLVLFNPSAWLQVLEMALHVLTMNGIRFTADEISELVQTEEEVMMYEVVDRIPESLREGFEHLTLELLVVVTTASRMRMGLLFGDRRWNLFESPTDVMAQRRAVVAARWGCHCDETPGVTRHKMCCSCVAPEAPITAPPREGVMSGSWQKISCPSGMVLSEPLTLCGRYSGCGPENYSWSTRSYCSSTCATSYGDCDSEAVCQTCIPTGTVSASTTTTTRPSFPYGASETCPDKPTTTTTTPNPYGTRRWEQVGIANRSACRGKNVRAAQSLEDCQELCRADFPRCKGIEYSKGRCELWTRVDGIFIAKELNGFTCMRFGWQTRALFRFGGEAACRGKGSTYLVKVAHSVEDQGREGVKECKAQCSAADLCTGIEFSMGRCEIWQSPIEFYVFRSGFACFRYDPENPALLFP
eukprot:g13336.t1